MDINNNDPMPLSKVRLVSISFLTSKVSIHREIELIFCSTFGFTLITKQTNLGVSHCCHGDYDKPWGFFLLLQGDYKISESQVIRGRE